MGVMTKNWWTTIAGVGGGFLIYLSENGLAIPVGQSGWKATVTAVVVALVGYLAKDATTGSRPASA